MNFLTILPHFKASWALLNTIMYTLKFQYIKQIWFKINNKLFKCLSWKSNVVDIKSVKKNVSSGIGAETDDA